MQSTWKKLPVVGQKEGRGRLFIGKKVRRVRSCRKSWYNSKTLRNYQGKMRGGKGDASSGKLLR